MNSLRKDLIFHRLETISQSKNNLKVKNGSGLKSGTPASSVEVALWSRLEGVSHSPSSADKTAGLGHETWQVSFPSNSKICSFIGMKFVPGQTARFFKVLKSKDRTLLWLWRKKCIKTYRTSARCLKFFPGNPVEEYFHNLVISTGWNREPTETAKDCRIPMLLCRRKW